MQSCPGIMPLLRMIHKKGAGLGRDVSTQHTVGGAAKDAAWSVLGLVR